MRLPFTTEQFFSVFTEYNLAVWPAQVLLIVAAITAVAAALSPSTRNHRVAIAILALLWVWMAVAYHLLFFVKINPAAYLFAALFVVQAALLGAAAVRLSVSALPSRAEALVAGMLIAYALAGYPAIGFAAGQRYPALPTFGLPCPTTIFTFGVLCLLASVLPARLIVIPVLWAAIGTSAAYSLRVPEDFGLPVAAAATITIYLTKGHVRKELIWT